jgi:hypothetical protein
MSRPLIPINCYNLSTTESGLRLEDSQRGCLHLLGVIFTLPGIFVLASLFKFTNTKTPEYGSLEWAGLLILGLAFSAFGLALGLYRSYIDIDLKSREIRVMKGIWRTKKDEFFPLEGLEKLTVSRMVNMDSDSSDNIVFPVTLVALNGGNFSIGYYVHIADALRIAAVISTRLGLKAYDTTVKPHIEITAADIQDREKVRDSSPSANLSNYNIQGLSFEWDGHTESLSRLFTAHRDGVIFYKIEYPRFLLREFAISLVFMGAFISFFGWRIDQAASEILGGFFDPLFLQSAEVFFTTIFGSIFVLFLVGPIISATVKSLCPPAYALVGISMSGLYLHDPNPKRLNYRPESYQNLLIRYADIKGVDIKIKESGGKSKLWKIQKFDNFIALRAGTKLYEIGAGLDHKQLLTILEKIKSHLHP